MARALGLLLISLFSVGYSPVGRAAAGPPAAAIASAHPLATDAGHEILGAGGNAFDAAVAVAATLAVVEPFSSGLGGGGFWLLHRSEDARDIVLDARETAPLAAHRDMYLDEAGNVVPHLSVDGPLSAAIPGTPAALVHLARRYGKLPLTRSLAPAVHYAREGFPVTRAYRHLAHFRLDLLRSYPASARIFLKDDNVPPLGYLIRQPKLAETLRHVAERGMDGFYNGPVAEGLVQGVRAAGGIWTLDDLQRYRVIEREPVRGKYRGVRIITVPPPSSGGIALITMLNILSGFDLGRADSALRKHLIIEAMRRAFRDRTEYLGDPDFVDVPVKRLLNRFYAAGLRASIRQDRATPSDLLPGVASQDGARHTSHFSIIDQHGNRVATTLTINYPFGSGFVAPGTGVLLNDEMDDFSAKPGVPNVYGLVGARANAIAPGKRPLSSMTPTFLESETRVALLGTPGGSRIITMVLLGVLDFVQGHAPASWVALPRFHHQFLPDAVQYETDAIDEDDAAQLKAMGHALKELHNPGTGEPARYGNMQAILWDLDVNKVFAASDPRGEGKASVLPQRQQRVPMPEQATPRTDRGALHKPARN